jgi:hypothetical protein
LYLILSYGDICCVKVVDDGLKDILEKPWYHAEAYHYWFLAHQYLYSRNFEYAFHVMINGIDVKLL